MIFVMVYILFCITLLFFLCIILFRIWNPDISIFIKNEKIKEFIFDRFWFFENKNLLQKKNIFFIVSKNSSELYHQLSVAKNIDKKSVFEKPFSDSKKPFEKVELDDSILLFFHENLLQSDDENQIQLSRRLRYNLYNILKIRKNKLIDGIIFFPHNEIFTNTQTINSNLKQESFLYSQIVKKVCKSLNAKIPIFFIDNSEIKNPPPLHLLKDENEECVNYNFGFFHKSSNKTEKLSREIKNNIESCVNSLESQMQYFLQKSENETQTQIILFFYQLKLGIISFSKNYCDYFYRNFNINESSMINFHFILNSKSFYSENNSSIFNIFEYISKNLKGNSDFSNNCIRNKVYKNYIFSAVTAASASFIIYALYASNHYLFNRSKFYINNFAKLDNFISQYSENPKSLTNLDDLKTQSCELFNTANQLNHVSLYYPLNFPSWNSNLGYTLDQNFDSTLTNFFSKLIMKNFNSKVNSYLSQNSANHLAFIEDTSSILSQINTFVDENEKLTEIYLNILSSEQGKTTEGLSLAAKFLFGIDCIKNKQNYFLFQNVERNKIADLINVDYNFFKRQSQAILNEHIQKYFNTIIKNNDVYLSVNKINSDLIQLKSLKKSEVIGFSKTLVSDINSLQHSILKGQLDFQNLNSFFGNNFYNMYKEVEDNPTFGKEIFENINSIAEEQFKQIKAKITSITPLGNSFPIVVLKESSFSVNPMLIKLSDSLEKMHQVFDLTDQNNIATYSKSFSTDLKSIALNLPTNALWSIDNIQSLLQRGLIFNSATSQINKLQYPKELSDLFANIEEELNESFWSKQLPTSLQIFDMNEKSKSDYDQSLDPYIQNIQLSTPVLKGISNLLLQYEQNDTNTYLSSIIRQQIDRQLSKYNEILNSSSFFSPIYPDFNWWDGESSPTYKAFSVTSDEDLKLYLSIQRDSLKKFFNKNITPILQAKSLFFGNSDKYVGDSKITDNFNLIQSSLDSSTKGTAFNELQGFFINSLLPLRTSNCAIFISKGLDSFSKKDFFSIKQNNLYHTLAERCQKLLIKQALANFDRFADNYNSAISGEFPFGESTNSREFASLSDINFVFSVYSQLKKQDLSILQKYSTLYKNRVDIQKFVKHMDILQNFFAIQLDKEGNPLPVTWNVEFAFRTNSANEILGNQIIDWSLQSGNQIIGSRQGNNTKGSFSWNYLQPLQFSVSLAQGSKYSLQQYNSDKNVFISNNTAFFTIKNRWSLLKFIEDYADCPKNHYCNKNDLKFDLPVNSKKIIRFYISLYLKNKNGTRINFPKFPKFAPYLLKSSEQKGT
ncbi:hypothetical protein [Fluviispira multicolorata]|uniref:IcmF-related N-terminal domain-containing protein n=1 Tax=Fluviispira multicolorata TaxID=2654512 RepID=A0A833N4Y2_9BACT|nr:hypothetical protein [Fluviispira multicolorata]KAB8031913.1 hypothetical protein GCL57_04515 [Fluviispira multicolorata]